jgi:hypothetical protein
MRRRFGWWLGIFLLAGPLAAAEPKGDVVLDAWDAAYLDGAKAGHVHTTVRTIEQDGRKLFRARQELSLTVKRFRDTVSLSMATGTDEDADGKVVAVYMKQVLGNNQQLVMAGTVEGRRLHVRVDEVRGRERERKLDKTIPWDDQVIGLYRQQRLFQQRRIKPGDAFSYQSYEPTIKYVVTTRVKVKGFEDVAMRSGKRRLLRVEETPEKLTVQNVSVQLPPLVAWVDADFETVRSEVDMPGLGKLTLYRTSAADVRSKAGQVAEIKDIGKSQLVRLNRRIPHAYDTTRAVYRITLEGDTDAASAFAQDARQTVKNVRGNSFELHVRAVRDPRPADDAGTVGAEYLESCYFINSADAEVRRLATLAVGGETDPWRKARRIERWVRTNMTNTTFTEAFATADRVARSRAGDCTEHAVLAAALCRAAGVPARTAFGLIYVENDGPKMGFHMWTEVWARGQWLPIDATLGRGFVGATHLKISDHSWHNMHVLTPLLPVMRVVGKVAIEVVRAE